MNPPSLLTMRNMVGVFAYYKRITTYMKRKYDIEKLSEREKDILFEGYLIAMEEYSSLIKATKDFMDNYNAKKHESTNIIRH